MEGCQGPRTPGVIVANRSRATARPVGTPGLETQAHVATRMNSQPQGLVQTLVNQGRSKATIPQTLVQSETQPQDLAQSSTVPQSLVQPVAVLQGSGVQGETEPQALVQPVALPHSRAVQVETQPQNLVLGATVSLEALHSLPQGLVQVSRLLVAPELTYTLEPSPSPLEAASTWLGPGWEVWGKPGHLLALREGLCLSLEERQGGVSLARGRLVREGREEVALDQVRETLQGLAKAQLCRGRQEQAVLPSLATFPSPKLITALFLIEKSGEGFIYRSRQCTTLAGQGSLTCTACKQFFDSLVACEPTKVEFEEEFMEEELHYVEEDVEEQVKVKLEDTKKRKRRPPPREQFQCHLCQMNFKSNASCQKHVKMEHCSRVEEDERREGGCDLSFPCDAEECGQHFKSPSKLKKHMVLTHGQDSSNTVTTYSVKCPYCPDLFKVTSGRLGSHRLRQHLKSVHQKLADLEEFREILSEEQREAVICTHCGKSYSNQATLDSHVKLMHNETTEMEACHICGKRFKKGGSTLWGHIRTHEDGGHECHICGAKFRVKSYLQRHVKSHDPGSKRYECDICGDKFSRPYLMKQHQEFTHKKNLPFKCNECGKCLRSNTFLKIHMRSVHNKEKPFPCEVCGFRSSRVDNLNIHRTKVHHLNNKVTRQSLKQSVEDGSHPFCSKSEEIPAF